MTNGLTTLKSNAESSLAVIKTGKRMIESIGREGMNEVLADQVRAYISYCNGEMQRLHNLRKPFTTRLTEIQKQFVKLEKDIDPNVSGSPAFEASSLLRGYLHKQIDDAMAAEQRLVKNRQATENRLRKRDDIDETRLETLLQRADNRLLKGQSEIRLAEVPVDLIPVVTEPEGYIDLLRYWWQEIGRNLPDSDLERIFRPAISFAKKQAKKGNKVESIYVEYRPEPKIAA